MANTIIQLKKSGVSGNIPSSLVHGELGLNYADGKLYYKNASNTITYIAAATTSNSFSTINVNSSLILASSNTDILSLVAGNNIVLTANSQTKSITISSTASGGVANTVSGVASISTSRLQYTATDGQTLFTTPAYNLGANQVRVYINGTRMFNADFVETSTTSITLTSGCVAGDEVFIEVDGYLSYSSTVQFENYTKFVFNIASTTSSISGVDSNSNLLSYDSNAVDVYVNGIRLVQGDDYTATDTTSIALTRSVIAGDTVEVLGHARVYISDGVLPISSTFSTATANQVFDSLSTGIYSSAKYVCQIKYSTQVHFTEVALVTDGTVAYITEYGIMAPTGSLGSFGADVNSGSMRLLFSPTNSNTTVKAKRITVSV